MRTARREDVIVRVAGPDELAQIAEAFADEAVARWVAPEMAALASTYRDFLAEALRTDEVIVAEAGDGIVGVSVWVDMPSAERARQDAARVAELALERPEPAYQRMATVLGRVAERHPERPHVFLSSMGVVPAGRGRGVGGGMLRYRLERADDEGQPAYLEASTQDSQRLYTRHGFTPYGPPILLPDEGSTLQPLWREPRS
ncbi:Acetyltransferase (GNAT) family protein [Amycolatopsis arida]|uniref:Acetyltransferase (GNAT) family protein n=1 Tax=Amycolatopsis arida TaxID=587909 RepID=A0A1I5KV58_9PSEU|nr:GNAT family N-acetyltransferase [Amycolatopsis arida]TDX85853.1 acetyltransferase (GNAT) family protein [Amycolatopsis arida]SFO89000.1 Acetyltransferase (GNAT) family protein [Amycolatopsis arida]